MLASYADTFAASWGRKARDTFREHCPGLFGVDVDPETAGGQQWQVGGHEGVMVTAGVGGGMTGKGAHLLIIDDPVKNADDAQSEVKREAAHDWWKSTARTRLQKGAGVVLVMTRWHEDDLAGRLISDWIHDDGDAWEILDLPAYAEEETQVSYPPSKQMRVGDGSDQLGREPGAPLWPDMFDESALEGTRRALGSYWWNALYMQRPAAAEGNLFKESDFRYYEKLGWVDGAPLVRIFKDAGPVVFNSAMGRKFMTVDCAESEKKTADYTVFSTWLLTLDGDLLLWDRERVKFDGAKLLPAAKRKIYEMAPSLVFVEKKSAGTTLLSQLSMDGHPVVPVEPDQDKITRALPAVARCEEHRVFFPLGEGWVKEEWEPELKGFPNASNDDQVDTLSMAAQQMPLMGGFRPEGHAGAVVRTGGNTLAKGLLTRQL